MRKIITLGLLTFLVSCVSTKFCLKPDSRIEYLSVCVNYTDKVPDSIKTNFDRTISEYIVKYNNEKHKFKLSTCNDSTKSAIKIYVKETALVSTKQQIVATVISAAGLSLPFVMIAANSSFYLAFWYFPRDASLVNFKLTDDLSSKDTTYIRLPSNSGYLKSQKKQIIQHSIAFSHFLRNELKQLEKQYEVKPNLAFENH